MADAFVTSALTRRRAQGSLGAVAVERTRPVHTNTTTLQTAKPWRTTRIISALIGQAKTATRIAALTLSAGTRSEAALFDTLLRLIAQRSARRRPRVWLDRSVRGSGSVRRYPSVRQRAGIGSWTNEPTSVCGRDHLLAAGCRPKYHQDYYPKGHEHEPN